MPFDSNGTFTRLRSWISDAAAGIKIRSDYHDNNDDDFALGLSSVLTKDGRTQPTANLPMNGKKIINLGDPSAADEAATKNYVDTFKNFTTGAVIAGANYPNGFLAFSATTGLSGISWAGADMAWVAKVAEASKYRARLAVNSKADASGNDVFTIDKAGIVTWSGYFANNLNFDGVDWRTPTAGKGTYLNLTLDGSFYLYSNDLATTDPNAKATLTQFFQVNQSQVVHQSQDTSSVLVLDKKVGSGFISGVYGYAGGKPRWRMDLGDSVPETGTGYVGSNFTLYCWDNNGLNPKLAMSIDRNTLATTFPGPVVFNNGTLTSAQTYLVLATNGAPAGAIYLRPGGIGADTTQCYAYTDGTFHASNGLFVDNSSAGGVYAGLGQQGRNGTTGGYTGYWHNWLYAGGLTYVMVNNVNTGAIQMVCDYRTKRNEKALGSTWAAVKRLRPIIYQYKGVPEILEGDQDSDEIRWGFVAHELQNVLTPSAASFEKDAPNAIQSPNLMAIIAALTKALQEAQTRIEALEAKLP